MDKDNICGVINKIISDENLGNVEVFFEDDDVLRLEVVSNNFKGMRLLKRIEILSELFIDMATTELSEFHLVFNPLTVNEKLNGESELSESSNQKENKSGIAASSLY